MAAISEDYVSFEVAKLLKEKDFDCETDKYYSPEGRKLTCLDDRDAEVLGYVKRPTLQLACKWVRKKYNIVISVNPQKDKYYFTPWQLRGSEWVFTKAMLPLYDKHEEACDAAIKYCLEKLI